MENHPIPQDITGFQFKLIGNMTVRQFIYLATGAIIAAFVFFILPIPFIIRLPIAFISASVGVAFAFIPVGGRPMDTMVANFFKALFAPTEYIYRKTGGDLSSQTAGQPQSVQTPGSTPLQAPQMQVITTPPPLLPDDQFLTPAITEDTEKSTETQKHTSVSSVDNSESSEIARLKKMLEETLRQKEMLEKELTNLKIQLETQSPAATENTEQSTESQKQPSVIADPTPSTPLSQAAPDQQNPASSTPHAPKQAVGLPIPEDPNLITGIVKDPRGNPLQNILVEVKDAEDNPVRAFKTNDLGQFASATSLANGKYTLALEDPKGVNKFDGVQIEATGAAITPIEIISVDPREELRRQLFN